MDSLISDLLDFKEQKYSEDSEEECESEISISMLALPSAASKKIRARLLLSSIGEKYFSYCLEKNDQNIYNICSKNIDILKLEINLMFPLESSRLCLPCNLEISNDRQLIFNHLSKKEHVERVYEFFLKQGRKLTNQIRFKFTDPQAVQLCIKKYFMFDQWPIELINKYDEDDSDLKLVSNYMKQTSDRSLAVKCYACNEVVIASDLDNHMKQGQHINNVKSRKKSAENLSNKIKNILISAWYYTEKFFCEICLEKFNSELFFVEHLLQDEHLDNVKMIGENKLQYNFCPVCVEYWYGEPEGYFLHCDEPIHRYLLKSRDYEISNMPIFAKNIINNYVTEIKILVNKSNDIDQCLEDKLLNDVLTIAKNWESTSSIKLFGSRLSRLAFPESDLDILINCNNDEMNSKEKLISIEKEFCKYEDVWIIDELILEARVPILKLRHIKTRLYCDISFDSHFGVQKSNLIRYFVKAYSPCRELILFVKKWTFLCRLSGHELLTTFAVSWMVIFYLQIRKILPIIHGNLKTPFEESNNHFTVADNTEEDTKSLLSGFFKYYSTFNYQTDVICPYFGKIVKKEEFVKYKYFPKMTNDSDGFIDEEDEDYERFRFDSPFCIQDPVEHSQNITKAVKKTILRKFRHYCSESVKLFDEMNDKS